MTRTGPLGRWRSMLRSLRGRFFWKLFTGHALLLVAVVVACVLLILSAFDRFYAEELTNHLRLHAQRLRQEAGPYFAPPDTHQLERLARTPGADDEQGLRITLIAATGEVLEDSWAHREEMENHAGREEVRAALRDGLGESTRYSTTTKQNMKYVAVRVGEKEHPVGVVRVAMAMQGIVARTKLARTLFLEIAVVVLIAAVALALGLARLWSRRIALVTRAARSISTGELNTDVAIGGSDEVALLARALNRMRVNLATQLETIERQKRTLEYLINQLQEGVIVAAEDGEVLLVNPAAARLVGWPRATADVLAIDGPGRRWPELPAEVAALLQPGAPDEAREKRLTLARPEGALTVLARSSALNLPEWTGRPAGTAGRLLVLTDITALTHTIQMKSDFVANASHELRTPLTAISGAVETLLSLDLAQDDGAAARLLGVVDRQAARLSALVADLLDLSRVEAASAKFAATRVALDELFRELAERFGERIAAKRLRWETSIEPGAAALVVNRELIVLVLDNLVDNAIKFTGEDGRVAVAAWRTDDETCCVSVTDNGCGIPLQEQDRVFERFYQVERSRAGGVQRGTGLGLAIVRHAVNAMGGRIMLESAPGTGTKLEVFIPQPGAGTAPPDAPARAAFQTSPAIGPAR